MITTEVAPRLVLRSQEQPVHGQILKNLYGNSQIYASFATCWLKNAIDQLLNLDNKRLACKPLAAYPSSIFFDSKIGGFHEQSRVG